MRRERSADAAPRMDRFAAADLLREAITDRFGSVEAGAAAGLKLRHDGGSCFRSAHYQAEITHLAIDRSPAFHYKPETNGVVEKFIQTLKEQVLWIDARAEPRYRPKKDASAIASSKLRAAPLRVVASTPIGRNASARGLEEGGRDSGLDGVRGLAAVPSAAPTSRAARYAARGLSKRTASALSAARASIAGVAE